MENRTFLNFLLDTPQWSASFSHRKESCRLVKQMFKTNVRMNTETQLKEGDYPLLSLCLVD